MQLAKVKLWDSACLKRERREACFGIFGLNHRFEDARKPFRAVLFSFERMEQLSLAALFLLSKSENSSTLPALTQRQSAANNNRKRKENTFSADFENLWAPPASVIKHKIDEITQQQPF